MIRFNDEWTFYKCGEDEEALTISQVDERDGWHAVQLPHTAHLEPYEVTAMWQGICWYKKVFQLAGVDGQERACLQFDGAMSVAEIWIDGEFRMRHEGGYLPFVLELSEFCDAGSAHTIHVRLDNRDQADVPPGKPLGDLDFCWYSGLYRNVWLYYKGPVHITNPLLEGKTASGGIFVQCSEVSERQATVGARIHIRNTTERQQSVQVQSEVLSQTGELLASQLSEASQLVDAAGDASVQVSFVIDEPQLWDIHNPCLHQMRVTIMLDGEAVDCETVRFGIRHLSITQTDGLLLNGERRVLRGTNYHQDYPYIGYALSDQAHYRSARRIKEAGFDYVRASHYPHAPAFMDACDEIGLVVMNCIPGWQYMGNEAFRDLSYRDCRTLIRRDRNHPCVIIWELCLNESHIDNEYAETAHRIGHEELPGDQCYTSGYVDVAYDVFIGNAAHGDWGHGCDPYYYLHPEQSKKTLNRGKPCIVSEYGHWEFGGDYSTSRQKRGDGEGKMLVQAYNHIQAHNKNRGLNVIGDGLWAFGDYSRGSHAFMKPCGIVDIFKLPKFSYSFFKSQTDAGEIREGVPAEAMVFIASYWSPESDRTVTVFSNCEEVELYHEGQLVGRRLPLQSEHTQHLKHPPFVFEALPEGPGTLEAVGYLAGQRAASDIRTTPGKAERIELTAELQGVEPHPSGDTILVYASLRDRRGMLVPVNGDEVTFAVSDADLLSPLAVHAEAGIATALIRTQSVSGRITVQASATVGGRPLAAKLTLACAVG